MQSDNPLSSKIDYLPSTRSTTISRLKFLDIRTLEDLLNFLPRKYEDRSTIASIFSLQVGDKVAIIGKVKSFKNQFARSRLTIQTAVIEDSSGTISCVWFNQRYLATVMKPGATVSVWGEVKLNRATKIISPQEYEVMIDENQRLSHIGRVVPIYQETRGLSTKTIREKMQFALKIFEEVSPETVEFLPNEIISKYNVISEKEAYQQVHNPESLSKVGIARQRLAFDELFTIQLAAYLTRKHWEKEKVGNSLKVEPYKKQIELFTKSLPFVLTEGQNKVTDEILLDLEKTKPMNRFLQGDVGSGKTVVAAIASYVSFLNGFKTLVMAPTEILAQQHFATLSELFKNTKVKVSLVTGGTRKKVSSIKYQGDDSLNTKYSILNTDLIVGTQALLHKKFEMKKIGLVVIDEQHRFGVRQRSELKQRGLNPHLLTMTATPIPRTVALTVFGELDMSILNEMPLDRIPIKSWVVPSIKRDSAYDWITKQIKNGDQIFIICPLIEESGHESMKSTKAAIKEFEYLSKNVFSKFKLGLLHGKLKSTEKESIMKSFKNRETDILVSTSVVEVGIDIPNATIILIEGAERFGLAQLHQLRGRVGRGTKQSYCLLFTTDANSYQSPRLDFFSKHLNGIDIAEYDLRNRGAGEIYGTRQHGYGDLKIASLSDLVLIERTKKAVEFFVENFKLETQINLKKKLEKLTVSSIARD